MKQLRILSLIVLWFGALVAYGAWGSHARGQWYEYQPKGAVNGKGILKDVTSRTHDPQLDKFRSNKATWTHEATHCVNSDLRSRLGKKAFYVGGGRVMVLSDPNISFEQLDRHVTAYRNSTYRLYLAQARSNNDRLDFLDEWSAYCNDVQCKTELNLPDDGGPERAMWFAAWCDALVATVRECDPSYSQMGELQELVDWQDRRLAQFARGVAVGRADVAIADEFEEFAKLHAAYTEDKSLYRLERAYKGRTVSWDGVVKSVSSWGTFCRVRPLSGEGAEASVFMGGKPIPRNIKAGDHVRIDGTITSVDVLGVTFHNAKLTKGN